MLIGIDLFCGVGGLSLGFEQAGFKIAVANEIDGNIAEGYKENFPETDLIVKNISDIDFKTKFSEYKDNCDIIIGGPPCQGLSQKGKRNFMDERNYLFKHFYKIVKEIKPQYFLIENVPNLVSANKGYYINTITKIFSNAGYKIDFQILSALDFGVPQRRKRAFILGKYDCNKAFSLPIGGEEKVSVWDAISDLSYLESGEGEERQIYKNPPDSDYQKRMRKKSKILYNHKATNHSDITLNRLNMIPIGGGKDSLPENHLTKSIYSGTWCRLIQNEPAATITTRFDTPSSGRFTHPTLNRAITVREAARLQSFPDDFIFYGSKSTQMKQVGNAVPPLVGYNIGKKIIRDING